MSRPQDRRTALSHGDPVADAVRAGLTKRDKTIPPWLFYDEVGSRLFERITTLPEYYLTRAERSIFERHGAAIVAAAADGQRLTIVELGAGTATKSQILLRAAVVLQGRCLYVPVDVSCAALDEARLRIGREEPNVSVEPLALRHEDAFPEIARLAGRRLVLFIGSSIGNHDEASAIALLSGVRRALRAGDAFLLGTDLRKDPAVLIAAYDDAAGVTAAFNKNVLARINRELGGKFDLDRFRHVALWNERGCRIEMHLESTEDQRVPIAALGIEIAFRRGERIHTESCVKYDEAMVDRLLGAAGFRRETTVKDARGQFAVHLARA